MSPQQAQALRESADALLNDREVAALLGLTCDVTPRVWRNQGWPHQPPFIKFGKSVRYRMSALRKWMDDHTVADTKPRTKARKAGAS